MTTLFGDSDAEETTARILIIGAGAAGYTSAIYAARAGLAPVLLTGLQRGGQLTITTEVENFPGFASAVQGPWLMDQMQAQAIHVGAAIHEDTVISLDLSKRPFRATCDSGRSYLAETVVVATGAQARWLGHPREQEYTGYGVSACATCDGFFFRNKPVVVIGGGNTAVEETLYLTNHASSVTLVHRRDQLKAERILQDRLLAHPKVRVILNNVLDDIVGTSEPARAVQALQLRDTVSGEVTTVEAAGVFIAIGHDPASGLVRGQLDLDAAGYIRIKPWSTGTSVAGVFAAGDVADPKYRQAITAAGMGCMAALEAQEFLAHQPIGQ
jgi:thioredoxin reductase (NADPH)